MLLWREWREYGPMTKKYKKRGSEKPEFSGLWIFLTPRSEKVQKIAFFEKKFQKIDFTGLYGHGKFRFEKTCFSENLFFGNFRDFKKARFSKSKNFFDPFLGSATPCPPKIVENEFFWKRSSGKIAKIWLFSKNRVFLKFCAHGQKNKFFEVIFPTLSVPVFSLWEIFFEKSEKSALGRKNFEIAFFQKFFEKNGPFSGPSFFQNWRSTLVIADLQNGAFWPHFFAIFRKLLQS